MLDNFTFIRGEVRKITYELRCNNNRNFSIENASCQILNIDSTLRDIPVFINGHDIEFTIDTNDLTNRFYTLIMTCRINEETIKNKVNIEVIP